MGIIIDETLSWENHIEYISTKIKCGIGVLGRSKGILSKELLYMLYKTLIEPYFRNGNTIWGKCHQTLQYMQNRAARIITDISYEDADHPSILYRLGWLSIRHLIVLDLAVAMFKVPKGIAPHPHWKCFIIYLNYIHMILEVHPVETFNLNL